MQSYNNRAAIEASLHMPLEPRLHRLLTGRVEQYREAGVLDLTHILVIEPCDTENAIIETIGFSPLANPMDGARYGSSIFQPYWDGPIWRHDAGYYELVVCMGNLGFAYCLFITNAEGMIADLLSMCREFAEPVQLSAASREGL